MEVLASNGGLECQGEAIEVNTCNTNPCPVDCEWGPYGQWSQCSKSCGRGKKSRTRSVAVPASNGGEKCLGRVTEEANCMEQCCPGTRKVLFKLSIANQMLIDDYYD